jgi:FAD:protein FMN transferase
MAFSLRTRKYLAVFLIIGWAGTFIYFSLRFHKTNHQLKPARIYRDNRILMGTFWEVVSPSQEAGKIIFAETSRIEQLLSKYIAESEISRLNRLGKLKVSPDTFYIIKKSKEFYQLSQGAFDITIGPLVDLWSFTDQIHRVPSDDEIKAALKLVGSDKIILHEFDNVVEFKLPGMKIDLGAIAKGFALDCAVKKLKENKINSCLINAGGQVYALGDKSGQPWEVAVRGAAKSEIVGVLRLRNQSVSTSADYEQFFAKDGKRYGHILDPKTGYSAESGITSVTIIADNGLDADALSTGVFVLGRESAEGLLSKFPSAKIKIY